MKMPRAGWCLPFHISSADATAGARFGGAPPKGVVPGVKIAETSYLMTIPWASGEISVFIEFDPFPSRSLLIETESLEVDEGWPAFADHKIGGQPIFHDADLGLLRAVDELAAQGFAHGVQLCFPSPQDARLQFNWPFANDTFHLFVKNGPPMDFRFVCA
jgi:hypothetical protein